MASVADGVADARELLSSFTDRQVVIFTAVWDDQSSAFVRSLESSISYQIIPFQHWHPHIHSQQRKILHVEVGQNQESDNIAVSWGCSTSFPYAVKFKLSDDSVLVHSNIHVQSLTQFTSFIESDDEMNASVEMNESTMDVDEVQQEENITVPEAPSSITSKASSSVARDRIQLSPDNQLIKQVEESGACVRIFVGGDKTHCGKTSVALGILGGLHKAGVPCDRLAYIKPATQCEAPDLIQRWCEANKVSHCEGSSAPLVFYKGFTREFLNGNLGTSESWIHKIAMAVDQLAVNKSFVIVDGVGFPAVGSIVGVSNAEVST
jgi:hypothetical protein